MIATYILLQTPAFGDSLLALILPIMVHTWFVFLMRSYFSELPRELIEAARWMERTSGEFYSKS